MPRREFVLKRPFDGPTTNFIATSIQLQASTMVRCTIALLIDILVVSATLSWPQAVLRQVPVNLWRLQDVPWIRDGIAILRPSPTDTNTALRNCLFIDHCQRCLVHLQCALLWERNSRLTCCAPRSTLYACYVPASHWNTERDTRATASTRINLGESQRLEVSKVSVCPQV